MRRQHLFRRLRPPSYIRLSEINDLARLACAFERAPLPVFRFELSGEAVLATEADLFQGSPVFYYIPHRNRAAFLGYRISGSSEEVLTGEWASNPSYIYAPIITVERLPKQLARQPEPAQDDPPKYITLPVSDLASLARIGSYKVLFDEPPLPLFLFPAGKIWGLGVFTRIDDYDEASLFFYNALEKPPSERFLRYSASRPEQVSFCSRVDDHGYIFIKIIKLDETHPLVEIEQ